MNGYKYIQRGLEAQKHPKSNIFSNQYRFIVVMD